jgi:hypothetical protein
MARPADLNDRRDLYNGFGDGFARAFEFAATPAIFGLLGYVLDRAVGTLPVFTIILAVLCIVGMFLKTWYAYEADMQAQEARAPWGTQRPPARAWPMMPSSMATRDDGPAVERQVAADLIRRALPVAPVVLLAAGLGWGLNGTASAAYALALVLANFAASAAILAWAARTSLNLLLVVALVGYVGRLALITVAVLAISGLSWFSPIPLCATLVLAHLGLLIWETRYVSASLAYPGLKPRAGRSVAQTTSAASPTPEPQKGA